ncbi:MAG: type II toxin-antitoxin system RelE/ParE family toxin [Clostridiales bacterium]|jgi:toxin ParE1/3/4|nr:type II toxin-antitoxin system RelE/ParE family toxin [Clostridiales bacterium]
MRDWNVLITPDAVNDLDSIYCYISDELMEPGIAAKQIGRIKAAITKLNHMPYRHPLVRFEPWKSKGLRHMPINNYLVFYIVLESKDSVLVMRTLYSKRDIEAVLGDSLMLSQLTGLENINSNDL